MTASTPHFTSGCSDSRYLVSSPLEMASVGGVCQDLLSSRLSGCLLSIPCASARGARPHWASSSANSVAPMPLDHYY